MDTGFWFGKREEFRQLVRKTDKSCDVYFSTIPGT
jgi:hypothetical protein